MRRGLCFSTFVFLLSVSLSSCINYQPDQFYGTWKITKAWEYGMDRTHNYHYDITFWNDSGNDEFYLLTTGTNIDPTNMPHSGTFTTGTNKIILRHDGTTVTSYDCSVLELNETRMVLECRKGGKQEFKVECVR